jgi:hypothetical protein
VIRPAAFEAAAEYVIVDKHLCGKRSKTSCNHVG